MTVASDAVPTPAGPAGNAIRGAWAERVATHGGLWLLFAGLFVFLALPLATILIRSFEDRAGVFVGAANFGQHVGGSAVFPGRQFQFAITYRY